MSKLKLDPSTKKAARALVGKTISRVILNPFDPNEPGCRARDALATDPTIQFTDGTSLVFSVEETDAGQYGVGFVLRDPS
jgi:hypothetical protein